MPDAEWAVPGDAAGIRLDRFLAADGRCGSRGRAVAALERGKVFVNGAEATDPSRRLSPGDIVRLWMDRPGSATKRPRPRPIGDLEIVYEDDALIAVNKPAGLLAVPLERKAAAPSALRLIEDRFRSHGRAQVLAVHRIDQDTSGLVLFAKHPRAQRLLLNQFKHQEPERVYLAVVRGRPDPAAGTWSDRLTWDTKALIQKRARSSDPGARDAISHYRTAEALPEAALLEVRLQTGRRNQIRIQAALHGHPLIGDRRYGSGGADTERAPFRRQALHAWRLTIRHPDGGLIDLEAPPPADFMELLRRLRSRHFRLAILD